MSSAKLTLALENIKAAEKALKTSFLKWSPDYDTAASEYTKAATNFKLAGSPEKCNDAYVKASLMQEKLGSLFHAAKLLTQAAGIAADLKKPEDAVSLMERACSLYREDGKPDSAAMTLSKAGKMCESSLPSKSVDLYLQAADLCESDNKIRDAGDFLNNAVRMQLKQKNYIKCAEIMKRRLELMKSLDSTNLAYTITLGMVIVYLAAGDYVSANHAFKDGFKLQQFGESDEAFCAEDLIKAFEEGDVDLLTQTKSKPLVTHMDTEIARLARSLKLGDVEVPPSSSKHLNSSLNELEQFENDYERKERGVATDERVDQTAEDDGDFSSDLC